MVCVFLRAVIGENGLAACARLAGVSIVGMQLERLPERDSWKF
jgi:hypothetical protein